MRSLRMIVPIKQVPETGKARMDEETGTIKREGVESIINPLDLYSIETALRIREACGGEVTTLSMGPRDAHRALREAIAMGCDKGILVTGRRFAGSDSWATSYALSVAVRRLGPFDLIVCGERATDGDTGQVGPSLAAHLDVPPLTYVSKVEVASDNGVRATRLVENGYEVLFCPFPCLITVVKEIADPRLPTLRGKRKARQAEVPVWDAEDMNILEDKIGRKGSRTWVQKVSHPRIAREGERVYVKKEEDVGPAVDKIMAFLDAQLQKQQEERNG